MLQELLWWQSCWCWLCPYRLEMIWELMVARVVWPWDNGAFAIYFWMSIYSVRFATLISSFNCSILVLCAYWKRFDYTRAVNEDRTTYSFLRLNSESWGAGGYQCKPKRHRWGGADVWMWHCHGRWYYHFSEFAICRQIWTRPSNSSSSANGLDSSTSIAVIHHQYTVYTSYSTNHPQQTRPSASFRV